MIKKNGLTRKASAKWGFTLIEILVVVTIIGLLAGAGAVSYSQFIKQARDARRKADLELIRSALEQFRADQDRYPTQLWEFWPGVSLPQNCPTLAGIPCYMNKVPQDPINSSDGRGYSYTNSADSYTLGALLEGTATGGTCGTCKSPSTACNYCLGPYGEE